MSPEQARELFAAARVARLATADASGRPHVVPIVFALDRDTDTLFTVVDDKPKRTTELKRLANIRANPAVSVLVDHYEENWSMLWWVRADGTARIFEPHTPEAQRAIALLAGRYPQQRATGEVIAVEIERFSGWSAA